jgi:hypothetical protein
MKVSKLIGVFAPQFREPSTCEACGARFTCGATLGGCWCSEVETSAEVRAELRGAYARCLCRDCLEAFARGERRAEAR